LDEIRLALETAGQYQCLRRHANFHSLKATLAATPGPGTYTCREWNGQDAASSPGERWDSTGNWRWKTVSVRDEQGGVGTAFVRVGGRNAPEPKDGAAPPPLSPGQYDTIPLAVYLPDDSGSGASSAFATEARDAIDARAARRSEESPGPGEYTHEHAAEDAPGSPGASFRAPSREELQARETAARGAQSPLSEMYDIGSSFGAAQRTDTFPLCPVDRSDLCCWDQANRRRWMLSRS